MQGTVRGHQGFRHPKKEKYLCESTAYLHYYLCFSCRLIASKAIIDAGKFSLFNRYPDDKAKNYQRLFLEEDNEETILAKKFVSTIKGHNFDYYTELQSFAAGWANGIAVTVEMVNYLRNDRWFKPGDRLG